MTDYARSENGVVVEIFQLYENYTPGDCFHPDLARQFVPILDGLPVDQGWLFDGDTFTPPPPPVPSVTPPAVIGLLGEALEDRIAALEAQVAELQAKLAA